MTFKIFLLKCRNFFDNDALTAGAGASAAALVITSIDHGHLNAPGDERWSQAELPRRVCCPLKHSQLVVVTILAILMSTMAHPSIVAIIPFYNQAQACVDPSRSPPPPWPPPWWMPPHSTSGYLSSRRVFPKEVVLTSLPYCPLLLMSLRQGWHDSPDSVLSLAHVVLRGLHHSAA